MILVLHYFRSLVSGGSRLVVVIIQTLFPLACDSEVGELDVALVVENEVFRFEVTVDDFLEVACLQRESSTSNNELRDLRLETLFFDEMVPQVSACEHVQTDVQVQLVVASIPHVDDEVVQRIAVVETLQELQFFGHTFDVVFGHHPGLGHLFHRVHLAVSLDLVDLSEASSSDDFDLSETVLVKPRGILAVRWHYILLIGVC